MIILNEKTLAIIILILIITAIIFIIRSIFRFIGWALSYIWYLLTGKYTSRNDPLKSKDWLTRAQARQEIRFQNALPPLESEIKKQRKPLFKRKQKQKTSQTESSNPYLRFENNPDWKWDERNQLWRHRSQWDKIK